MFANFANTCILWKVFGNRKLLWLLHERF